MSHTNLSDMRLQEVRKSVEKDYGKGAQATLIVRNEKGEIVMFMSGGAPEEIEAAIRVYRLTNIDCTP